MLKHRRQGAIGMVLRYPLPEIVQAAELSAAIPDDIAARLRSLEQSADDDLRRRRDQWRDNDRAAQASWARLASMVSSVGARADPYRSAPMPQPDPRLVHFIGFTRRLAAIRSSMKPLRFHMLVPPPPEQRAQIAALAPDGASFLPPRTGNAHAQTIAMRAAADLRALELPTDWPDAARWRRELRIEALDATELAARCAGAREQQQEAARLWASASSEAVELSDLSRARANRCNEARARVRANEYPGACLAALDAAVAKLSISTLPPPAPQLGKWLFAPESARQAPPLLSPSLGLFPLRPSLLPAPLQPTRLTFSPHESLARAEIHEAMGDSQEARRLIDELARIVEPKPGQIICPTRAEFVAAMMEAVALQQADKPFVAAIAKLRELSEKRALALSYCNVGGSAFCDTDPARARRYREQVDAIANM